jgi:hypothetical protein
MMADMTHPGDTVTKDKIKLPLWMWAVGGAVVLGVGYFWYRSRQKAAATPAADTSGTTNPLYANPTTILPMFQGGQAPVNKVTDQQFDTLLQNNPPLPYQMYTVTGKGPYTVHMANDPNGVASNGQPVNDQWPSGAAIAALGLSGNDLFNISYYATMITLENLGLMAPYPIGTQLRIPYTGPKPALPNAQTATNMQYLYQPQTSAGTSAPTAPNSGQ